MRFSVVCSECCQYANVKILLLIIKINKTTFLMFSQDDT